MSYYEAAIYILFAKQHLCFFVCLLGSAVAYYCFNVCFPGSAIAY